MPISRPPAPFKAELRPGPERPGFDGLRARAANTPLIEILPAAPGDHAAALGFALAWACAAAPEWLKLWAAPETARGEDGAPHAEGLAQFGVALDRLLVARSRTQEDALWATEQSLRTPQTLALCTIAPAAKPLSLTATRRLLLAAETHNARCVLLRFDRAGASAAWTRWIVRAAPSQGAWREVGAPRFNVQLMRNRAGASGQNWLLEWNAHEHAFHALDGPVDAAPADRPADARQRRAV